MRIVCPGDSHEISCLICYFLKTCQNLKLSSAANYRWRCMGLNHLSDLQIKVRNGNHFPVFQNQRIIILWCSKELSRGDNSFEHPKHIL